MKPLRFVLFVLAIAPGNGQDGGWRNTVSNSPAYQQMPASAACAKDCIINVTSATGCTVSSCVCGGDTGGTYFVKSSNSITDCARQQCSDPAAADVAAQVFTDICNGANGITTRVSPAPRTSTSVAADGSASARPGPAAAAPAFLRITDDKYPAKYAKLQPCSKFVLNSCRDASLARVEPATDCYQIQAPGAPGGWYGLGNATGCSDARCLCQSGPYNATGNYFNVTYHALANAGISYCALPPTLSVDYPSPEFESLAGVVADFCVAKQFPPDGWYLPVAIAPVVANNISSNGSTNSNTNERSIFSSRDGIISFAVPLGVSVLALAGQLIALRWMWPAFRQANEALKEMDAKRGNGRTAPAIKRAAGPPSSGSRNATAAR